LFIKINSLQRKHLNQLTSQQEVEEKHEEIFQNGRKLEFISRAHNQIICCVGEKFALKVYCGDNEPALDSYLLQKDHSLESNECTLHAQQR
jgi:hypothetical protein